MDHLAKDVVFMNPQILQMGIVSHGNLLVSKGRKAREPRDFSLNEIDEKDTVNSSFSDRLHDQS